MPGLISWSAHPTYWMSFPLWSGPANPVIFGLMAYGYPKRSVSIWCCMKDKLQTYVRLSNVKLVGEC